MALKEKGVAAEYLSSTQTSEVRNKVISNFSTILHYTPQDNLSLLI